ATVKGIRVAGEADATRARLDRLTDNAKKMGAAGLVWMRVGPDGALDSPVAKFLSDDERAALVKTLDVAAGDLLLLVAGERAVANRALGALRLKLGRPPVDEG